MRRFRPTLWGAPSGGNGSSGSILFELEDSTSSTATNELVDLSNSSGTHNFLALEVGSESSGVDAWILSATGGTQIGLMQNAHSLNTFDDSSILFFSATASATQEIVHEGTHNFRRYLSVFRIEGGSTADLYYTESTNTVNVTLAEGDLVLGMSMSSTINPLTYDIEADGVGSWIDAWEIGPLEWSSPFFVSVFSKEVTASDVGIVAIGGTNVGAVDRHSIVIAVIHQD